MVRSNTSSHGDNRNLQVHWQHRSLRKLTLTTLITKDIAHSMIRSFPDLLELDVLEMAHFWIPPSTSPLGYSSILNNSEEETGDLSQTSDVSLSLEVNTLTVTLH